MHYKISYIKRFEIVVLKFGSENQLNVHNYLQCWCNWTKPQKTPVFAQTHLKNNKVHQKSHALLFIWKKYYEVLSKISSTIVQLGVHFLMKQNEQQRNLKDLKSEE